jgi:hypothetical protein
MASLVARLDRQLARKGETVTLRRRIGTTDSFATLTTRLRISGYAGDEIAAGIELRDSKFIMSPSAFDAAPTWAGAAGGPLYPKRGDFIVSQGVQRHVEQCLPVMVGDVVVRIEGRIR